MLETPTCSLLLVMNADFVYLSTLGLCMQGRFLISILNHTRTPPRAATKAGDGPTGPINFYDRFANQETARWAEKRAASRFL